MTSGSPDADTLSSTWIFIFQAKLSPTQHIKKQRDYEKYESPASSSPSRLLFPPRLYPQEVHTMMPPQPATRFHLPPSASYWQHHPPTHLTLLPYQGPTLSHPPKNFPSARKLTSIV